MKLSLSKSTSSLFGPPDLNLAHAYVPYLSARDCIAKMVEDMKKMKRGHISIVNGIEANYRSIEDETQVCTLYIYQWTLCLIPRVEMGMGSAYPSTEEFSGKQCVH